MKISLFISSALILLFANLSFGQMKTFYHRSTLDPLFTKCENPPTFGKDSLDLQKYLSGKLQKQIPTTKGKIRVQLVIDKTGKVACEWIENNSNLNLKRTEISLEFDAMPDWNSGIQNGRKVNCAEIIILTFDTINLTVENKMGHE